MILDTLTKLEAVLAGAVAGTQPVVHVDYIDWNNEGHPTRPTPFKTALNNGTDVTILAAPMNGAFREPIRIAIYNGDSASITLTVKTDDGTERILIKVVLLTLETLNWEKERGWYAIDANGNIKEVTGSVFSSITLAGSVVGAWTTPTFDAANFTANGSMTWTVASGDVQTYAYTILNKAMTVSFSIITSTVGGTPDTTLRIAIPAGKTATKAMFNPCRVNDNGTVKPGYASVGASGTVINIDLTSGNFAAATDATSVSGEITFEIN